MDGDSRGFSGTGPPDGPKVFKSEVQPVEIAGALQRECDNNATIWNRDR
ncbi:FhaA domain-containing protein, partial [Streptomyces cellulosae]